MSHDSRADQIAFHLYTKLFAVVNQARTTSEPRSQPKLDRWFNLETPDSDLFSRDAREPFKSVSQHPPPPLEIQVLLSVPDLSHTNQGLVFCAPDSSRIRIYPPPPYVLLESYTLAFTPGFGPADVPLPTIYKAGIPLFRSLFTLLRLLPTWKLYKRLRRRAGVGPSLAISLRVRAHDGDGDDPTFNVDGLPVLETKTHVFTEVPHPNGTFVLSVQYLTMPTFQLDELESLLSSRFMSLDERPFVPTLAKRADQSPPSAATLADRFLLPSSSSSNSQRGIPLPLPDRQLASGSLPHRQMSLSRPPTASGQHRHTASIDPGHRPSPSGLEATRTMLRQESTHHRTYSASSSLSPTNSFFTQSQIPSNPQNLTLNTNVFPSSSSPSSVPPSSATASSAQGQTPPRRPVYPFPFKSNTLAASSSSSTNLIGGLGSQPSSLNDRVSLHERMGLGLAERERERERRSVDLGVTSPTSAVQGEDTSTTGASGSNAGASGATGAGTTNTPPSRKRYSSSFGHRYTSGTGLPGSAGSAGSGGAGTGGEGGSLSRSVSRSGVRERPNHPHQTSGLAAQAQPQTPLHQRSFTPSPIHHQHPLHQLDPPQRSPSITRNISGATSFLDGHTDDDDISIFVQDIDTRKPLVGRGRERREKEREREREQRVISSKDEARVSERRGVEDDAGLSRDQDTEEADTVRERGRGREYSRSIGRTAGRSLGSRAQGAATDTISNVLASPPRPIVSSPPRQTPTSPRRTTMGSPPRSAAGPARHGRLSSLPRHTVGSPPAGLMLTSEREVDERLRRMNEAFFKSLEGLGGDSGPSRPVPSAGPREVGAGAVSTEDSPASGSPATGGPKHFRSASGSGRRRSDVPTFRRTGSPFTGRIGTDSPAQVPEGSTGGTGRQYPSVFARPRLGASRDTSEEVIGRLEFDYEGGGGTGASGARWRDAGERY